MYIRIYMVILWMIIARKFEIMGLCQPVTLNIHALCHPFYIEYSDNFIAITDLYIRYYGLCTPYNIEYSDLIANSIS